MAKLPPVLEQGKRPNEKGFGDYFVTMLGRLWHQLASIINGNIQFYEFNVLKGVITSGNIAGYWYTGNIPTANTNFVITVPWVPIGAPPTPQGFLTVKTDKSTTLWVTATAPGSITIQSSTANVNVILFII